jgi:hypothetical protein
MPHGHVTCLVRGPLTYSGQLKADVPLVANVGGIPPNDLIVEEGWAFKTMPDHFVYLGNDQKEEST